jgi:hypothetical protein
MAGNRQTFTTYINALMDQGVDRNFAQLDQLADRTFSSIQTSANKALSGVDARISQFRNSFQDVSRVIEGLSSGLTRTGSIDLGLGDLRQAAADARLYEEGLRTMLRTVSLSARETQDSSVATRNYIGALEASLTAAQAVTRETEDQVAVMTRYQTALDKTASSSSRLAQAERDRYAEQAAAARLDSVNATRQDAINSRFAPGLTRGAATDAGAGFSALDQQIREQEALVRSLTAGVAQLERQFAQEAATAAADQQRVTLAIAAQEAEYQRLASAEAGAARGGELLAGVYRGTAAEMGRVALSARDSASAFEQAEREQDELNASIARLRANADPVVAVIQRYTAALEELDRVQDRLDPGEYTRLQGQLTAQMNNQVEKVEAAQRAVAGYGNTLRGQRTAYIQAGQQFQDIAISFAGGQRASTILAQQLPQLAYAFVDVGGKVGKVATTLAGPYGLALVGASFLVGGLIDRLMGASDANEKARSSTIDFTNTLETSRAFVNDYAASINALEGATRSLINTQAILIDSLQATSQQAVSTLSAQVSTLDAQIGRLERDPTRNLPGFFNTGTAELAKLKAERATVVAQLEKAQASFSQAETALEARRATENADSDLKAKNDLIRERARLDRQRQQTLQQGTVPLADFTPIGQKEYEAAVEANERKQKALADAIKDRNKAERKAASDASAAARQAAAEAEAAAKRRAGEKKDEEILALLRRRGQISPAEYERERAAIEDRYQAEILSIDATTTAHSKSTQIQIANLTRIQNAAEQNQQKIRGIVTQFLDAEPAARRAAKAIDQVWDMVDQPKGLGGELFTEQDARALENLITESLQRPYRDFLADAQRGAEIAQLQAAGYDDVAAALQSALQLQQQGAVIGAEQFDDILAAQRAQTALNDRLEVTRDINQQILGIAKSTREETNQLLVGIMSGKPQQALKQFGQNILNNVFQIQAKQVTAKLFEGADAELRGLLDDSDGVTRAIDILEKNVKDNANAVDTLDTVLGNASTSVKKFGDIVDQVSAQISGGGAAGSVGGTGGLLSLDTAIEGLGKATKDFNAQNDPNGPGIIVNGRRQADLIGEAIVKKQELSSSTAYGKVFGKLGGKLDESLGTNFFGGLGKSFGTGGLSGASIGSLFGGKGAGIGALLGTGGTELFGAGFASSLSSAVPYLGAAAAANSMIGDIFGFEGGPLGVLTGPIKSFLNPSRSAGATLTGLNQVQYGGKDFTKQGSVAVGLAASVFSGLEDIADQLGATIGSFNTTIGIRDGDYRVNTSGTSLKTKNGAIEFDDDMEGAIAYAISDAISDGALQGISMASQTILKNGSADISKAITKALAIEDIPKRLKALKDPVGAAIDDLNDEFEDLISYLKEGGATAEQFAQAQELYDLERAQAIEDASNGAIDALQDFLDSMTNTSESPLSKRTVYGNAQEDFAALQARVAAGESVDQDELLAAAQNFQDASRALYGSSSSFFNDFDAIFDTITQAKDALEESAGSYGGLAGSPFETDTAVKDTIASIGQSQLAATNSQTQALSKKLDDVVAAVQSIALQTNNVGSATSLLQNF